MYSCKLFGNYPVTKITQKIPTKFFSSLISNNVSQLVRKFSNRIITSGFYNERSKLVLSITMSTPLLDMIRSFYKRQLNSEKQPFRNRHQGNHSTK